jgi:outer membrane biosynthesis protein TonB
MARANNQPSSLRFGRREGVRLSAALLLSLLMHFSAWCGYEAGKKMDFWAKLNPPSWLRPPPKPYDLQAQIMHDREPTIFVDVSHADADAPKQARYYSDKNSHASNPDAASANVPKLTGNQPDVPKTEDVPKPAPKPPDAPKPEDAPKPKDSPKAEDVPQLPKLQPSLPPPQLRPAPTEPAETPQKPGDLDPLKPKKDTPVQPPAQPTPPTVRPRTLKAAQAQQQQIPGQQMQQDGGVPRRTLWSSLDTKATPFGEYDRAIIEAVSQRWYDFLDSHKYAQDRSGKVILQFKLKPDGSIIEIHTLENTVGELLGYLCQEAVEEAAPFAKWPDDMQRMIGANYREITFTFYYY